MTQEELVKQSSAAAEAYIAKAIAWLDARYGDGFAFAHPKMVEIYVTACIGWANAVAIARTR